MHGRRGRVAPGVPDTRAPSVGSPLRQHAAGRDRLPAVRQAQCRDRRPSAHPSRRCSPRAGPPADTPERAPPVRTGPSPPAPGRTAAPVGAPEQRHLAAAQILDAPHRRIRWHGDVDAGPHRGGQHQPGLQAAGARQHRGEIAIEREIDLPASLTADPAPLKNAHSMRMPSFANACSRRACAGTRAARPPARRVGEPDAPPPVVRRAAPAAPQAPARCPERAGGGGWAARPAAAAPTAAGPRAWHAGCDRSPHQTPPPIADR